MPLPRKMVLDMKPMRKIVILAALATSTLLNAQTNQTQTGQRGRSLDQKEPALTSEAGAIKPATQVMSIGATPAVMKAMRLPFLPRACAPKSAASARAGPSAAT